MAIARNEQPGAACTLAPQSALRQASQAEFESRDLMRGSREVLIRHAGQVYRLRHTRNDKLILVK
jgi:hemin uptake protein HemP